MARTFGNYSPAVPLGVTWEESILLQDDLGAAINLTGYDVRAQLRAAVPVNVANVPTTVPILELTTVGYYATLPAWPVVEAFSVPTPTNGTILSSVAVSNLATMNPTNAKTKLVWAIVLVNKSTGYAIPVVKGHVLFLPATTTP